MKHEKVKQRDILQDGDEIRNVFGWRPIDPEDVGKEKRSLYSHRAKIRRKIYP